MENKRKWQFTLIIAVIVLTIYNILPTLFYYAKPLKDPISSSEAQKIGEQIAKRVDQLEAESIDWIQSYCELIGVKPESIRPNAQISDQLCVRFAKTEDAAKLRAHLPRAGSLISFAPSQLSVHSQNSDPKEVAIQRAIPGALSQNSKNLFSHIEKYHGDSLSPEYREFQLSRLATVQQALNRAKFFDHPEQASQERLEAIASQIQRIARLYEQNQEIAVRYAQFQSSEENAPSLIAAFDLLRDTLKEQNSNQNSPDLSQRIETKILVAESFVKKHAPLFSPAKSNAHPLFKEISIDWENDCIRLILYPELRAGFAGGEIEQLFVDEVAKISHFAGEDVERTADGYKIALHKMDQTTGMLVLRLDRFAEQQIASLVHLIQLQWHPTHPDLAQMRIATGAEYTSLPLSEKALSLIVTAPVCNSVDSAQEFRNESIYVLANGLDKILKTYEDSPNSPLAKLFMADFRALSELLSQKGFYGYLTPEGYRFEQSEFYAPLLSATREEFYVVGSKREAILELTNVEQRILTLNKIETAIHDQFLEWTDEYRSAQVSLNSQSRFDVPKPTGNILLSNLKLSLAKLVRGDERKILRWGLDLSGGKTVEIELRDANNRPVTGDAELRQGINELFDRVNKMGVSDVSIRQLGSHIVLDFPGGQSLSANELIRSSSMYFHIVNEKFSPLNPSLSDTVNRFLQEVWNRAVVSRQTDARSINAIAYKHLHGDEENPHPRTDAGRSLLEHGLRLANPEAQSIDESFSKVAVLRGTNPSEWSSQSHPLLVVFAQHALEGAQLDHIQSNYDPSKGNYLSFEVKGSSASNRLHQWTSKYSKESIAGTDREELSRGRGWRMAVLLNDSVISAPTLESALKSSASISGSFTQREVNQLAADLKAGSMTFTPHILSEKNVSPELGKADQRQGILAMGTALALVVVAMITYYRFAGLIASIAVLFNLLILWATLQNLGASLSLAGIAGIILTVGMAVDANVLVFERVKEEFALTGRIQSAIRAGYEKAFSAILDSNVTTIIAALILLNFDAGPIKAFAMSMFIGIASSMFTALFMTRFYFEGWLQNPKHKALSMANWIHSNSFDFLKRTKSVFGLVIAVIAIGAGVLFQQRNTIFGMDFTGGYALHIELDGSKTADPLKQVEQALLSAGVDTRDLQIRQHDRATHFRILLGTGLEQPGQPFFGLPHEIQTAPGSYAYQKNPRIDWVVKALEASDLHLAPASLATLETDWTSMSGQMSDSMRNNAIGGLLIAIVAIFIYIAIRFEYKYAISAILCLLHDVLITLGLIGILHACKVPVQIDLSTIAALMTIIGYSLNDTIIIFDRIREDAHSPRRKHMTEIVNRALNSTLSRTAITSGTTLLVLLALVFLGGSSIFSFSLVMVIGVVFGTLSSWFIAAPLLLFFHRREETKESLAQT